MTTIDELYRVFRQHPVVTTDSRNCPEGSMFFALKGERFDGNQYAAECLEKGCCCAVVDDPKVAKEGDGRYVLVDNVLHTLQLLARHHRRTVGTKILGITGTNGKTTTKELCAAVLQKKFNVLYTQGNLNNSIGVPLTLLKLTAEQDVAVVEMGASHPGDIQELVELVEPQYGLITNVGRAHLLGFGSFEGVCRTKGELYDFLREHNGTAFVNQDNEFLPTMAHDLKRIDYIGAKVLECSGLLKVSLLEHEVQTHLVGAYNTDNLRAAATVGLEFGVDADSICQALEDYVPSNNRSQYMKTADNELIVDAYNANPTSMAAALDNFAQVKSAHKMCIIGMMGELGQDSHSEHEKLLNRLASMPLEEVWLVGSEFQGFTLPTHFRFFSDVETVKAAIAEQKPQGHTILVKGSNSTKLFQLPELL